MLNRTFPSLIVAAVLVAVVVLSRLLIDEPNFAAAGAVALFSGFVFRNRLLAIGVPMVAMLASDAIIGFYSPMLMAGVYASLALAVALGVTARRATRANRVIAVVGVTLAGSVSFFVMSNLFVWLGGSYGRSFNGLIECYAMALPFFRNTLASDAIFAGGLFGAYAIVLAAQHRTLARTASAAA